MIVARDWRLAFIGSDRDISGLRHLSEPYHKPLLEVNPEL